MAKSSDKIAVRVEKVKKDFLLPHEQMSSIKSTVLNIFRKRNREKDVYHALRGVSFDIKEGEFFGIVGRNGSGKSTLLKIIANIYQPTSGKVEVKGKLVPFIELGVGFNPELTGRENVFLNGALLGFSRQEIEEKYDSIVEFAELKDFMDQQLKNYSSGMQVRLAFSVAIQADADVLLIDEVLAVGDEAFQRKCLSYFAKLKKDKKTVIFVTHSMDSVQQFCDRVALIDKGHKAEIGSPLKIAQIYRDLNNETGIVTTRELKNIREVKPETTKYVSAETSIEYAYDRLRLTISLTPKVKLEDPIVAFQIIRDNGEQVMRWTSDEKLSGPLVLRQNTEYGLKVEIQNIFAVGEYSVNLLVRRRDRSVDYGLFNDMAKFTVINPTPYEYNTLWRPKEKILEGGVAKNDIHKKTN